MTLGRQIALKKALAWLALLWERLWPALLPPVAIAGLFVALALFDLPALLPPWLHLALVLAFAAAILFAGWHGFRRLRLPDAAEARRRLERDSGLAHRPLQTLEDTLPDGTDAVSARLWQVHRSRLVERLGALRVKLPRPNVPARDPWALRAGVFLLLVIGGVVGGADAPARLWHAMTPQVGGPPPPPPQFDAWINPPDYTGVAPIKLTAETPQPVVIPKGSTLLARLFGGSGDAMLALDGKSLPFRRTDPLNQQIEQRIDGGERLAVSQGGDDSGSWAIRVAVDQPPRVTLPHDVQVTAHNVLRIPYEARDDYGLTDVTLQIRLDRDKLDRDKGTKLENDRVMKLSLPLSPPGTREASEVAYRDLTPHPWAGLPVVIRVVAHDSAKQEGRSKAVHMILPERPFSHPVARAIIEQRRILARQPERQKHVALALDAIGSVADAYDGDVVVFLALSTAAERLRLNVGPENRDAVSSLLWDTALRLEDGTLSLAERDLRKAQRELMDALARNADEAEIQRLMDKLQQAMDRYLQAMAEQAMKQGRQNAEQAPPDPNSRMVEADDLRRMLDRARELSRMGAHDAARQMLQQLQDMLERLQNGRMTAQSQQQRQTGRAMRELGDLMQNQQRLLDRTYRSRPRNGGQQGRAMPGGRNGQPQEGLQGDGRGDQDGMRGLAEDQEGLRRRLGELMRQLGERNGKIPGGLGRAERDMRDSREALGQGQRGNAVRSQSKALDQLAEGLREMAERMQQQAGNGRGGQRGEEARQTDPAGRPLSDGGMATGNVEVPDQWQMQRAREILQELRRRAGQRTRPLDERRYIDRLLEQF